MATAKKIQGPALVQLTLTLPEARSLLVITYRVGGHPDTTMRRHTDAIAAAIHRAIPDDPFRLQALEMMERVCGGRIDCLEGSDITVEDPT